MTVGLRIFLAIRALSDWACRCTELLLCFVGGGMALLIMVQVFSRYVLNHSLFWSEEVGRICLVWITFLGASAAYKRHAHMGIDFFVNYLPEVLQKAFRIFVLLISCIFFGVLVFYGFQYMHFLGSQRTPALGILMKLPYSVIPLSGLLLILHGISHLLENTMADNT